MKLEEKEKVKYLQDILDRELSCEESKIELSQYSSLLNKITNTSLHNNQRYYLTTDFHHLETVGPSALNDEKAYSLVKDLFDLEQYLSLMDEVSNSSDTEEVQKKDLLERVPFFRDIIKQGQNIINEFVYECYESRQPNRLINEKEIHLVNFLLKRRFITIKLVEDICCNDYSHSIPSVQWKTEFPLFTGAFKPFKSSQAAALSVVDFDTNQAQRTKQKQQEKDIIKAQQICGTIINSGKITQTSTSAGALPNEEEKRKAREARARLYGITDDRPTTTSAPIVTSVPLRIGGSTGAPSKILNAAEKEEQTQKKKKIELEEQRREKANQTLQAVQQRSVHSTTQLPMPTFFNEKDIVMDSRLNDPVKAFASVKRSLQKELGLNLRGELITGSKIVDNGLIEGILAHYAGTEEESQFKKNTDINSLAKGNADIIKNMKGLFSRVWKDILIISVYLDKQGPKFYLNTTYCNKEKLSSVLNQPYIGDQPFFILNYPDNVGDRYYILTNENKKRTLSDIIKMTCEASVEPPNIGDITYKPEMSNWPFEIIETPGDGDCFFTAVANQLPNKSNALEIRQLAVNLIKQNEQLYRPFLGGEYNNDMDMYLSKLKIPGKMGGLWGGNIEIQALTKELKQPIIILSYNKKVESLQIYNLSDLETLESFQAMKNTTDSPSFIKPIWLYFSNGNHYDQMNFTGDDLSEILSTLIALTEENIEATQALTSPRL